MKTLASLIIGIFVVSLFGFGGYYLAEGKMPWALDKVNDKISQQDEKFKDSITIEYKVQKAKEEVMKKYDAAKQALVKVELAKVEFQKYDKEKSQKQALWEKNDRIITTGDAILAKHQPGDTINIGSRQYSYEELDKDINDRIAANEILHSEISMYNQEFSNINKEFRDSRNSAIALKQSAEDELRRIEELGRSAIVLKELEKTRNLLRSLKPETIVISDFEENRYMVALEDDVESMKARATVERQMEEGTANSNPVVWDDVVKPTYSSARAEYMKKHHPTKVQPTRSDASSQAQPAAPTAPSAPQDLKAQPTAPKAAPEAPTSSNASPLETLETEMSYKG